MYIQVIHCFFSVQCYSLNTVRIAHVVSVDIITLYTYKQQLLGCLGVYMCTGHHTGTVVYTIVHVAQLIVFRYD